MKQQGFTLTELMVALVISSILLLGISTFLIASQKSWQTQLRLTSSQEIERFVVQHLRRAIRQASGVDSQSDEETLILEYHAQEGSRNCLGQLQEAGSVYTDRFHVSGDQLRCNGVSLISGVAQIRFTYGMDQNSDGRLDPSEFRAMPDDCCPIKAVTFLLSLSGINEAQQPLTYSASLRRK